MRRYGNASAHHTVSLQSAVEDLTHQSEGWNFPVVSVPLLCAQTDWVCLSQASVRALACAGGAAVLGQRP